LVALAHNQMMETVLLVQKIEAMVVLPVELLQVR
jgi:hypothetical protein